VNVEWQQTGQSLNLYYFREDVDDEKGPWAEVLWSTVTRKDGRVIQREPTLSYVTFYKMGVGELGKVTVEGKPTSALVAAAAAGVFAVSGGGPSSR